jgi:Ca2+-binding RTX toxin-like protein
VSAAGGLRFPDASLLRVGDILSETLFGGDGDDALFGGNGADNLRGRGGDNFVQGNQGDDMIVTDTGADTVLGGKGDDIILTGVGVAFDQGDVANGNLGNDSIAGGGGADLLLGGQGNDVIGGLGGLDTLNGNLGDDRITASGPLAFLLGEDGADTLEARGFDSFLAGGAGADLFRVDPAGLDGAFRGRVSVLDWSAEDRLSLAGVRADHGYAEAIADPEAALATANVLLAAAARPGEVVAVQAGPDVFVLVNSLGDTGADYAVRLVGRTLADIDPSHII